MIWPLYILTCMFFSRSSDEAVEDLEICFGPTVVLPSVAIVEPRYQHGVEDEALISSTKFRAATCSQ